MCRLKNGIDLVKEVGRSILYVLLEKIIYLEYELSWSCESGIERFQL